MVNKSEKKFENRVLIITGILPVSAIEYKKNENDILLVTEDEIKKRAININFEYVFLFPDANKFLSRFSAKWLSYYKLKQKDIFESHGRSFNLFPVFLLPRKLFFRNFLVRLSLFIYKARIEKIIQNFQPLVIHAHDSDTSAYVARFLSKKYNIPYIITLRGLNKVADKQVKKNLKMASTLVAISSQQIKVADRILPNCKLFFIPHGIGEHFYNSKLTGKKINNPIRLVTVARLLKLKNIDLVIKSMALFQFDFVYDIYGVGPEDDSLKLLIKNLGLNDKIRLKGSIPNQVLNSRLKEYDIFVMPSYPESLGRVYFEAMASGLPVIATKNTGIDGIITHEKEGFLLNHKNVSEFTSDLHSILFQCIHNRGYYQELSKNAREFADHYSWDNVVPKYLKIYNQIDK